MVLKPMSVKLDFWLQIAKVWMKKKRVQNLMKTTTVRSAGGSMMLWSCAAANGSISQVEDRVIVDTSEQPIDRHSKA